MLQSHLIKESAAVHYISRMSEKLRDAIADGAWQLLQHFVCHDYKTVHREEMEQGEFTAGIMHTAYILVINLSNQKLKNVRIR